MFWKIIFAVDFGLLAEGGWAVWQEKRKEVEEGEEVDEEVETKQQQLRRKTTPLAWARDRGSCWRASGRESVESCKPLGSPCLSSEESLSLISSLIPSLIPSLWSPPGCSHRRPRFFPCSQNSKTFRRRRRCGPVRLFRNMGRRSWRSSWSRSQRSWQWWQCPKVLTNKVTWNRQNNCKTGLVKKSLP